ncbi:MAG: hypothetical protein WAT36_13445 [Chromatiaceae bacterium]
MMAKSSEPNSFGLRDNYSHGKVADFLAEKIVAGAGLSIVSAYFTIHAYNALSAQLLPSVVLGLGSWPGSAPEY